MRYIILSVALLSSSIQAETIDAGCYNSANPKECRGKLRQSIEDMNLQKSFYETLHQLDDLKNKDKDTTVQNDEDSAVAFGNRRVRGRDVPSVSEPSPVIFVDSVYGSESLKAVVNLLGENITVSKGSSLFGGAWTVTKVSRDSSVMLNNGTKNIKISSAPINISSILKK
jgi:hypothetical protein